MLRKFFNPVAASPYNGVKPFIMVDIADDDPSRGDSHGFVGLAERITDMVDGEMLYLDAGILKNMYPDDGLLNHHDRLKALIKERGAPDILFSRIGWYSGLLSVFNKLGTGLIVNSVNESLTNDMIKDRPHGIVSHHLNPKRLAHEGDRFAQEFSELPRPFIALNVVDLIGNERVAEAIMERCKAEGQGTVFVCSSRRTSSVDFQSLLSHMKHFHAANDLGDNVHIVDYDFRSQIDWQGPHGSWNPYVGLLDQADHIVIEGRSESMISEPLATGKVIHTTVKEWYQVLCERGLVKSLYDYEPGEKFETPHIEPVDVTADLANIILQKFHARKAASLKRSILGLFKSKDKYDADFCL